MEPDFPEPFLRYKKEIDAVLEGIRDAIKVTLICFHDKRKMKPFKKPSDGSNVTLADFAAQAYITSKITRILPEDYIISEEKLENLGKDMPLLKSLLPDDFDLDFAYSKCVDCVPEICERYWVIDPIDGTSSFIKGGQYAVGVALLVGGRVVLSFVGYPLYSGEIPGFPQTEPAIIIAVENAGLFFSNMKGSISPVPKNTNYSNKLITSFRTSRKAKYIKNVVEALNLEVHQFSSMIKGILVGTGHSVAYVRDFFFIERSHDIAPFDLIVREGGGISTDGNGKPIEYLHSGTINSSSGSIFTNGPPGFHQKVVEQFRRGLQ